MDLTIRANIFAKPVTWRVEGDHLVRETSATSRDLLPLAELQEVHVWRTMRSRRFGITVGGHMEARLRIAGRWWALSGHHTTGPGQISDRSPALIDVLSAAVRRRLEIGGGLVCRVGSGAQKMAAVLVWSIVALAIAALVTGLVMRGTPLEPEDVWKMTVFAGVLFLLIRLAVPLVRNGKKKTLTAEEFLRHRLIAMPA
jgi:hypothetical protein